MSGSSNVMSYARRLRQASEAMSTWADRARCTTSDPDLFFPPRGASLQLAEAKRICRGCPVRQECLDYALAAGERFGVWGGTSERERRRIWSRRRAAGEAA